MFTTNGGDQWQIKCDESDSNKLYFFDDINDLDRLCITQGGKIGMGTAIPSYHLDIQATDAQMALTSHSTSAGQAYGPDFYFRKSGHATVGSHTTMESTETLGNIWFQGSDGNSFETGAAIFAYTKEAWSGSALGSAISFATVDNTTTVLDTRMTIDQNGNVGIGTTSPAQDLDVAGIAQVNSINCDVKVDIANGTFTNTSVAGASMLRVDSSGGHCYIKGLDGGVEGQMLYIIKTSNANELVLYNNSTNASAGDRILLPGCTADDDTDYVTLAAGYGGWVLIYQGSYWRSLTPFNATITA